MQTILFNTAENWGNGACPPPDRPAGPDTPTRVARVPEQAAQAPSGGRCGQTADMFGG